MGISALFVLHCVILRRHYILPSLLNIVLTFSVILIIAIDITVTINITISTSISIGIIKYMSIVKSLCYYVLSRQSHDSPKGYL